MKNFLVAKKRTKERIDFINSIDGDKFLIYNHKSEINTLFDKKKQISLKELMKDFIFLDKLAFITQDTNVILADVLIKNAVYSTLYGKIYAFTEQSKHVFIIDSFAFKWDEKQIFRPFLFINPEILGSSLGEFFNTGVYKGFEQNNIDHYFDKIKNYIDIKVSKIKINLIKFNPTKEEIDKYEKYKKDLIYNKKYPKTKIVSNLIKFVDNLENKKNAISNSNYKNIIKSNLPRNKFKVYEMLSEKQNEITFVSSGIFGADEIELNKTKKAIERHNYLISKYEKIQQK